MKYGASNGQEGGASEEFNLEYNEGTNGSAYDLASNSIKLSKQTNNKTNTDDSSTTTRARLIKPLIGENEDFVITESNMENSDNSLSDKQVKWFSI